MLGAGQEPDRILQFRVSPLDAAKSEWLELNSFMSRILRQSG